MEQDLSFSSNQIVVDVGEIIGKIVVHELEPVHGDQTTCEGLVDKTNYHKVNWDCTELFHTWQIQSLEMWTRLYISCRTLFDLWIKVMVTFELLD